MAVLFITQYTLKLMIKFRMPMLYLMLGGLLLGSSAATATTLQPQRQSMTVAPPVGGDIESQMLKKVLNGALEIWPNPNNYSYGTLRSSYNHGALTIVQHVYPQPVPPYPYEAFLVTFDGITVCVIVPI